MKKSVIVIGGGIAGLTVAFRLKQADIDVTLVEKHDVLGGALGSVEKDGFLVETGPNTVLETSPKVTELIRDLGLESSRIYANERSKNRYIVRDQKPVPLPMSPKAFFTSPLFSWRAKLRLMREPFTSAWDNAYEESLEQFVQRRLGQEFLDYAINPFVAGVYAGSPAYLSVQQAFPKLYALEQRYGSLIRGQIQGARERKKSEETSKQAAKMLSFTHGLKMVPEMFESILGTSVKMQMHVDKVIQCDTHWEVQAQDPDQKTHSFTADGILYAGRITDLPVMELKNEGKNRFESFSAVYHPPVSILAMGFDRNDVDHPLDGFGVLIPEVESLKILGVLFSSTLFENRAPEGQVLLTVFIGGARQPENAMLSEGKLVELALQDLKTILGVRGTPTFVHHVFWKQAIPQYHVGYGEVKSLINDLEQENPGLFFAGNYRNGISVADTIVNGTEVAHRIQTHFEGA